MIKIDLVGVSLKYRSFAGANKALPVLASRLHDAGFHDVNQFDLERPDLTAEDISKQLKNTDLVCFCGCMTPQWPEIDSLAQAVRQVLDGHGKVSAPIIVGGYATKGVADLAKLTPWITAYFDGEGENGIVEIAHHVDQGTFYQTMAQIGGLCFVDGNGRWHHSIAERVKDFNDIDQHFGFVHVPEKHDMDIFRSPDGRQFKTAQLFTQRGCPFICSYCDKSMESNVVARVGINSISQQLAWLKANGYEAVYLDVDTFTINTELARQEADLLFEYEMPWGTNTRIDMITLDQIKYFVRCGCVYMFFGVEHILPEVLVAISKFNGSVEKQLQQADRYQTLVKQVFQNMAIAGLPSSYFIILGLPKAKLSDDGTQVVGYVPTTFEDDMAAVRFGITECNPDYFNFNILRFMPGSAAADIAGHPAYVCVRPSGFNPITTGYFLPRVAQKLGYRLPDSHGVYRLCESVGLNQPITTAVDPERVYRIIADAMKLINQRIDTGQKPTTLFIDREVLAFGLVRRDLDGRYSIAPLKEFETLN